jgi:hypothetical protein
MATGDDTRYPARGQLVDVGGSRLHIYCVGEGSPTVVLDAGLGGFRWIGRRLIGSRHEYVDANRSAEVLAAEHKQQLRFQRVIWITARIGLVRAFWAALWPKFWPTTQKPHPGDASGDRGASSTAPTNQDRAEGRCSSEARQRPVECCGFVGKPPAHCAGGRRDCEKRPGLATSAAAAGPTLLQCEAHCRRRQQSLHSLGPADVGSGRHQPSRGGCP